MSAHAHADAAPAGAGRCVAARPLAARAAFLTLRSARVPIPTVASPVEQEVPRHA